MLHLTSKFSRLGTPATRNVICRAFSASAAVKIDFDPYNVLGVDKLSSASDIKKAYYQLVKKYHPDVNKDKDAEKRFHKIQESYELLSDKDKRAQYDRFGGAAFDANGNSNPFGGNSYSSGNPFQGAEGNPFANMGFDFENLFSQAFNGGARGSRGRTSFATEHVGDDIEVIKTITFKEAIFGTKLKVNYKAVDSCKACSGRGLKAGKQKDTCPTCHGTGQITHIMGGFQMASTCTSCSGSGATIKRGNECNACNGNGVEEVAKSADVELPCGIADGLRLRIPGGGDAPFVLKDKYNLTRKGDLIIRVHVLRDDTFERSKNNIILKQQIAMTTAALGGEIVVPTVDGENVKLKLRAGVQLGKKLVIPEKGVPINKNMSNRGDMEVVLSVKTLIPETPMQTALLEALADAFDDKTARRTHADWKLETDDDISQSIDEKDLNPSKLQRIGKMLGKFFNFENDRKQ